jgi:UDP-2-acetamido-2-deoxy-ribo-hexuluronate aminotransferase
MKKIQMVDLGGQYKKIKVQIDLAIQEVIDAAQFIKGSKFEEFQKNLGQYLRIENVIACGNGTDALQIAMMALNLKPGDEVIVPAFTYVATVEVIGLLGLVPVMVDVDYETFNISIPEIEKAITLKTKLIVPVHIFGQCANMEAIMTIAKANNIYVVEDAAQSIGAEYTFSSGQKAMSGCMGDIGCTSFFPSKNLGCFGDGGAIFSNDKELSRSIKMIANHGQSVQYVHDMIGINSRLDNIQAAILVEKLKHLDNYCESRISVANYYDSIFDNNEGIRIPLRDPKSTHVFHQYTLKVYNGKRDELKKHLASKDIPSMIYYPIPIHHQNAFQNLGRKVGNLKVSEQLCTEVLSLPIHTEMDQKQVNFISESIIDFFNGK